MPAAANDNAPTLISMNQVVRATSLSRTMLNRYRAKGRFPAAVPLGDRRFAFVRTEVDAWIAERIRTARCGRSGEGGVMEAMLDGALKFPTIDPSDSASLNAAPKSEIFKFVREDWAMFRSLGTLSQKAGVPSRLLRRLVIKELVDNALDAGGRVTLREDSDWYIIEDNGPGIAGTPEEIATLFSIKRPMVSTKLWRMPTRGALGNGLRVVAGAVLASQGNLVVITRNMQHVICPLDDGSSSVESTAADMPVGTHIGIRFGPDMPEDAGALGWGRAAIQMARGETYSGKTSPWWYDAEHFYEVLQASGARPVRSVIEQLDGCSGAKAGIICRGFKSTPCSTIDREGAVALLGDARLHARAVKPARLGTVGPDASPGYAACTGTVSLGLRSPKAEIPFVVEAWATVADGKDDVSITMFTNRTPVTGKIKAYRDKKNINIFGCGLGHRVEGQRGFVRLCINIIAPYIPITTDGKEPDLAPFIKEIGEAAAKAIRKAKQLLPRAGTEKRTQKEVVIEHLDEAAAKASGDGAVRFTMRQLFYAVRPFLIAEFESEPKYGTFEGIITDFENERGTILGLSRDARGTLYHPHEQTDIPIGTLSVERYRRPEWTFNKVLFIEKEGFFEALKAVAWPERYDCALLTSKGFSTRAVRDLVDLLAEDVKEKVTVFCVHDADASGTMIYQSLQDETKARARRKVNIVNLGLDPWEAEALGLENEPTDKDSKAPVARYVSSHPDGQHWADWLQQNRYELNTMTMPQFIAWLDGKMEQHGVKKVVPPEEFVADALRDATESIIRESLADKILEDAGLDGMVADAMAKVDMPSGIGIGDDVADWLADNPTALWRGWVDETAEQLAA